jgi:hypothetical protein
MSVNTGRAVGVERDDMIRCGVFVVIALLLVSTPAGAAGDRAATPLPFTSAPSAVVAPRPTTTLVPPSSPFRVTTQPLAPSRIASEPLPASVLPGAEPRHHRRVGAVVVAPLPQVIVVQQPVVSTQIVAVVPSQCVAPGYWSYRWVPYTTTDNVWVSGSWAADGSWIDSHWEPRPYSSGYYEPYWTPEQPYAC